MDILGDYIGEEVIWDVLAFPRLTDLILGTQEGVSFTRSKIKSRVLTRLAE